MDVAMLHVAQVSNDMIMFYISSEHVLCIVQCANAMLRYIVYPAMPCDGLFLVSGSAFGRDFVE